MCTCVCVWYVWISVSSILLRGRWRAVQMCFFCRIGMDGIKTVDLAGVWGHGGCGKRARDVLTDTQSEAERVEGREGWRGGSVGERMGWISNPALPLQALASHTDSCMLPLPSLCFSLLFTYFLLCLGVPVLLPSSILAFKSSPSCTILRLSPSAPVLFPKCPFISVSNPQDLFPSWSTLLQCMSCMHTCTYVRLRTGTVARSERKHKTRGFFLLIFGGRLLFCCHGELGKVA